MDILIIHYQLDYKKLQLTLQELQNLRIVLSTQISEMYTVSQCQLMEGIDSNYQECKVELLLNCVCLIRWMKRLHQIAIAKMEKV